MYLSCISTCSGGHRGLHSFPTRRSSDLFGFGAKAGLVPMHVWLPEAHPAAPSPVSALMSGVMLKTALYGLLRVTFDLLDRKSTRLNSSHVKISYAVFCLKKKIT